MTKDKLQVAVAICVLAGFAWGGISYFATAQDLKMVELRLDQKIMTDQVIDTKRQMWQLEERNKSCKGINEWDQRDREEYKKLQHSLEELQKRRDVLMKK